MNKKIKKKNQILEYYTLNLKRSMKIIREQSINKKNLLTQ